MARTFPVSAQGYSIDAFGVGRISSLQLCAKGRAENIFHPFLEIQVNRELEVFPLAPFEMSTTYPYCHFYPEEFLFHCVFLEGRFRIPFRDKTFQPGH